MAQGGSRAYQAIMYPENMIDDWKEQISHKFQVPFAYCVHDKDLTNDPDEKRKEHVHCIIVFPNTTTLKHATSVFRRLEKDGYSCLSKAMPPEACISIEHCYEYLIHDTDDCREKGKFQYQKGFQ